MNVFEAEIREERLEFSARFLSSYTNVNSHFLSHRILNTFSSTPFTSPCCCRGKHWTMDFAWLSFSSLFAFSADRSVEILIFVFPRHQPLRSPPSRFLSSWETWGTKKKKEKKTLLMLDRHFMLKVFSVLLSFPTPNPPGFISAVQKLSRTWDATSVSQVYNRTAHSKKRMIAGWRYETYKRTREDEKTFKKYFQAQKSDWNFFRDFILSEWSDAGMGKNFFTIYFNPCFSSQFFLFDSKRIWRGKKADSVNCKVIRESFIPMD